MRLIRGSGTLLVGFFLLGSIFLVLVPSGTSTSGRFTEDSDADFLQGNFYNTEVLGSGPSAKVALQKNNTMWMLMNGTNAPSPRKWSAMCFIPELGETLLFGGYDGTLLNDTWTYDFTHDEWTALYSPVAPSPRGRAGIVYDSDSKLVILYGGWDGSPLEDTWEFDPFALTWTKRLVLTSPGPMDSSPLSYDSSVKKVILIGNSTVTGEMETWAFDVTMNEWTNRNPSSGPTRRKWHAIAYYPTKDSTVLFGGQGAGGALGDTWEYNFAANTWNSLGTGGPAPRFDHVLFYHPDWDAIFAYAGRDLMSVFSDMWEYVGSSWSQWAMGVFPENRYGHAVAYDSNNGYIIMCCGSNNSGLYNDTWSLGDWYQLHGSYWSRIHDTGSAATNYTTLYLNQSQGEFPEDTDIRIQIASSVSPTGPWTFTGPDGTVMTWFNMPVSPLGSQYDHHRYVRYLATLLSWKGRFTPLLENMTICYDDCCLGPYLVSTDPAHLSVDVDFNATVAIQFSESMNTSSVTWDIYYLNPKSPTGISFVPSWHSGDTLLWLNHTDPFLGSMIVQVWINGTDLDGMPLNNSIGAPNPFVFVTKSFGSPDILWTDPYHAEIDVEINRTIQIEFSNPMNTSSLIWAIAPDPGGWTNTWYANDTLVVLSHSVDFQYMEIYTTQVTGAKDKNGFDLVNTGMPNPWQFRTEDICCPAINLTDPENGEMGVDPSKSILIQFTREIVPTTFHWNITLGPDPGGWSESWSKTVESNDTVTLIHSNPFEFPVAYCFRVERAKDIYGMDMVAPYDFCFVTATCPTWPTGLTVIKTPATVRLAWNPAAGATHYNIYHSADRYAPFPIGWSFNQVPHPVNTFDLDHLADGQTHYYIVRAYDNNSGMESANSTMGVKIEKSFTVNPARPNIYWMSLPFISEYSTASDIANELSKTNVNVIAKWDRDKQESISYYYTRGKWRGMDFTLGPGDGFYVNAVNNFDWDIVGTDSGATVSLPLSGSPIKRNEHWISVPYTGVYSRASDMVWDIEGGLGPGRNAYITEVGLWSPSTQSERIYYYTPSGWTGDDFDTLPGDGVYLRMVSSYTWSPMLVTAYVP